MTDPAGSVTSVPLVATKAPPAPIAAPTIAPLTQGRGEFESMHVFKIDRTPQLQLTH
jgi:hypothetical protein